MYSLTSSSFIFYPSLPPFPPLVAFGPCHRFHLRSPLVPASVSGPPPWSLPPFPLPVPFRSCLPFPLRPPIGPCLRFPSPLVSPSVFPSGLLSLLPPFPPPAPYWFLPPFPPPVSFGPCLRFLLHLGLSLPFPQGCIAKSLCFSLRP